MSADLVWADHLTDDEIAAVDSLLDRVSAADGVSAMSEHAYLALQAGGTNGERHALLKQREQIIGFAHISADKPRTAELLVDPSARGQGFGRLLLEAVGDEAGAGWQVWAHGNLPAAVALAENAELRPLRTLCRYHRGLADLPEVQMPPGMILRSFTVADAQPWLELNAAAFVDLPDQGSWTRADLDRRLEQPWFDAEGFLVAQDAEGLAGFHWTKVHEAEDGSGPVGEVYVLGVAPRARGTGLGAALTVAGLRHLADLGLTSVMLFVDAQNVAATSLYERMGFRRGLCDVLYASN